MLFIRETYCCLDKMGGVKWLIICAICVLMHAVKVRFIPMALLFTFRYNSPMVMFSSLIFFHWAMTWKLQNKWINWISASVLSVYILQAHDPGCYLLYGTLGKIHESFGVVLSALLMVLTLVAFFIVCILFDKIRMMVCAPINDWLASLANRITRQCDIFITKNNKQ